MAISLTTGNEKKALLLFSLPMIFGNLIQQLYNVADTLIVGKILGAGPLAAVGSSYTLMLVLNSLILGFCMGSGVVFAQQHGARKTDDFKTGLYNSFVLIALVTALITGVSFALLPFFVTWLHIPPEAAQSAVVYLEIILLGIPFVSCYNFFAAALRSVGNTVVPLVFLAFAALLNIVLDIALIVLFDMGIAGAAVATVIAQGFSALSIALYFFTKARSLLPARRHCHFDKRIFGQVMHNSLLTGVQQSIMNFGILLIQGLVNSFGLAATAAFAAVVKIDTLAYMPAQDFGNAFATFIAQNSGARQPQRIRRGTRFALQTSIGFCAAVSALVFVFAQQGMLFFIQPHESEILRIGIQYLRTEGACYVGIGILFLLYGLYRGLARPGVSIVLTVVSLGSRVVLAYAFAPVFGLVAIWWAIPIGWILADLLGFGLLFGRKTKAAFSCIRQ